MSKSKSGTYQVPTPDKSDIDQFDNRVKSIKKIKDKLYSFHDLHFSEVYDLIEKVKFMRKACSAFNSKFRLKKHIP